MIRNEIKFKVLNKGVTGSNHQDKDLDKWLYASLSQPPIEIIDKNGSEDELDYTVKCPNCGTNVNFGNETYMNTGHIYCSTNGCREKLMHILGKKDE